MQGVGSESKILVHHAIVPIPLWSSSLVLGFLNSYDTLNMPVRSGRKQAS